MRLKKIFWLIILGAFIIAGGIIGFKIYQDAHAWKVEVIAKSINLRSNHEKTSTNQIGEVQKGEKYKVLDIYLDDDIYVWYKIKVKDLTGWISSERDKPYVKEYNNPNLGDNTEESYKKVIDYIYPKVKFKEDVYRVYDLKSINYNHLTIEEENKYTITHKVFYEEHPTDTDIPQYWIQYIVTDEAGNTTKKVQKIEFDVEPNRDEVLDFKDLVR